MRTHDTLHLHSLRHARSQLYSLSLFADARAHLPDLYHAAATTTHTHTWVPCVRVLTVPVAVATADTALAVAFGTSLLRSSTCNSRSATLGGMRRRASAQHGCGYSSRQRRRHRPATMRLDHPRSSREARRSPRGPSQHTAQHACPPPTSLDTPRRMPTHDRHINRRHRSEQDPSQPSQLANVAMPRL